MGCAPKKPKRLPTVLTRDETLRVIGGMKGVHQLMTKLLAKRGSGLRLMECVRLRIKDVDFAQHQSSCAMPKANKTA